MKLGSLFDGSGGFPLAGSLCGIEPVWASEVEPYPIAVTRSRFPSMKHLGSVTEARGGEIEPVDVITFGSPCQDLSIAGKRAGLKHEDNGDDETTRSGLFMEAVRIIKEMRKATNGRYPTFAVWENVPGAFSSNKGEDLRTVLEELIKIVEPSAVMPAVPKGGWPYADSYRGDGWSIAYRVLDAQYWGVPQRRRRIYLVLDLRGQRAGKILFEREGVRGYFETGRTPWQGAAGYASDCTGADDCDGAIPINTMIATRHKQLGRGTGFGVGEAGDPQFTISAGHEHAVAYTLKIRSGCDGGGKGALIQTDKSATLSTLNDQYLFQPVNMVLDDQGGQQITVRTDGKSPTLRAETHGNLPCVLEAVGFKAGQGAQARSIGYEEERSPTLASEAGGNSVPSVCMKLFENHSQDSRYKGPLDVCPMLPAQLGTGGNNQPFVVEEIPAIPIHDKATRYKGGGATRNHDGSGNGLGIGKPGDPMCTLTVGDRHAVTYAMQGFGDYKESEVSSGLKARDYKDATDLVAESKPIAIDRAFFNQGKNAKYDPQYYEDGTVPTLVARGPSAVAVRYIVRRLAPTECARLQGFPDTWGHPDVKDSLTEEEYSFWLEVRNTHAAINGKATKDYTKEQMLNWYNKLHTDSSEYKMWGNGIALPTALYVMQGIAEALKGGEG